MKDYGFTLIEILIAISIGAIIFTIIYLTFFSVISHKNRTEELLNQKIAPQEAMNLINEELSSTFFKGQSKRYHLIGVDDRYQGEDADAIYFTTAAHIRTGIFLSKEQILLSAPYGESDLAEIGYYVKPDENGNELILFRRIEVPPQDDPKSGGNIFPWLTEVKSFNISYYSDKNWLEQWDTTQIDRLPEAIKIVLIMEDEEKRNQGKKYETIAIIQQGK